MSRNLARLFIYSNAFSFFFARLWAEKELFVNVRHIGIPLAITKPGRLHRDILTKGTMCERDFSIVSVVLCIHQRGP